MAEHVLEEDPDDVRELGEVGPASDVVEWVIGDRASTDFERADDGLLPWI
jgi:hypothetical protein